MPLSSNELDVPQQAHPCQVGGVVIQHAVMTLMTYGQHESIFFRRADHLFALGDILRHQLFAQDMQSGFHALKCNGGMLNQRYRDHDGLNIQNAFRFGCQ